MTSIEMASLYLSKPVHIASKPLVRSLATPIRPGIDGNLSSGLLERIRRVVSVSFCAITAPVTVSLALVGALLLKVNDVVKQTSYTHFKGLAKEKEDTGDYRFMTLNGCMLWGGLSIPLGGMRPPSDRMDAMATKIKKEDPDVLVMQEVAFDSANQLYDKIKDNYAHFYTRIGPNPPLMESGLFVASKYPVQAVGFIPFPGQLGIKRGAFWIETPKSYIFTTHMEFGHDTASKNKRKGQFEQVWSQIEKFKEKKPCFLMGDFNMDRTTSKDYEELGINDKFHDPYFHTKIDGNTATCTNVIGAYILGDPPPKKPWELDDYALLAKGSNYDLKTKLVETYDDDKPYQALTDHRGLLLEARVRNGLFSKIL